MSKIKIPLSSVIHPGFAPAMRAFMSQPLSMALSFRLARVNKEIASQVEVYEEARRKRIQEVGIKSESGDWIVADPQKRRQLINEIQALIEGTQISLPISEKFDVSGCTLTAEQIYALWDLVAEPQEEEASKETE